MIAVACAICVENAKVMVVQRGHESNHPLKWEFPGGKINPFETEEECIVREIDEELELQIQVISPLQPVEYDYGNIQIRLIPLICKITSGTVKLTEHHDLKWVTFDELKLLDWCEADALLVNKNREKIKLILSENQ
jgi:8-oxo-dGTP diphosphatase